MPGFNYGGHGDGTGWSSERGDGPAPGGGSHGNSGRDDHRGESGYGYPGHNGISGPVSLRTTDSYDGDTMSGYINNLINHEGFKNTMYRDTEGNITVGIGHLLSSPEMAAGLPFNRTRITHGHGDEMEHEFSVSREDITSSFNALRDNPTAISGIHLSNDAVIGLAISDVESTISGLKGLYSDFDSFPRSAKTALVDMGFSVGVGKLRSDFPNFNNAVNKKDWNTAADESHRTKIGEGRNNDTKAQFQQAANGN